VKTDNIHPLAVLSLTLACARTSYLIVGTCSTPTLLVFFLPTAAFSTRTNMEGMKVFDLAADPSGTALT
jgi:hypothetical protein